MQQKIITVTLGGHKRRPARPSWKKEAAVIVRLALIVAASMTLGGSIGITIAAVSARQLGAGSVGGEIFFPVITAGLIYVGYRLKDWMRSIKEVLGL